MSDVNLPILGKKPKGFLVFVGVGSAGAIAYFIWRRKQANASAATTNATSTDPNAVDPNAIDPNTGLPYSQESGLIDPATGIPYSQEMGFGTGLGGFLPTTSTVNPPPPANATPTTNGQWFQAAEKYLTAHGVNGLALSAALGKYLTGQELTTEQQSLVDQAIASQGYPPESGPTGFPPKMHIQAPHGQKSQVTVPNVIGKDWQQARNEIHQAGLVPKRKGFMGTHSARVIQQSPHGGSHVRKGSSVTLTVD